MTVSRTTPLRTPWVFVTASPTTRDAKVIRRRGPRHGCAPSHRCSPDAAEWAGADLPTSHRHRPHPRHHRAASSATASPALIETMSLRRAEAPAARPRMPTTRLAGAGSPVTRPAWPCCRIGGGTPRPAFLGPGVRERCVLVRVEGCAAADRGGRRAAGRCHAPYEYDGSLSSEPQPCRSVTRRVRCRGHCRAARRCGA